MIYYHYYFVFDLKEYACYYIRQENRYYSAIKLYIKFPFMYNAKIDEDFALLYFVLLPDGRAIAQILC